MDKLELALDQGIYFDGWKYSDYCLQGAPQQRWINTTITGEKSTYKSNTLLQDMYTIFHGYDQYDEHNRGSITDWQDMQAWQMVLHYVVYRPLNFDAITDESLKEHCPRAIVGWDDIRIHLSPALYSTNRKRWDVLSSTWAGSRALIAIFECTAPTKGDIIGFIRHDANFDIQTTGRKVKEVYRWFSKGDIFDPGKDNWYRIDIEKTDVHPENVPGEVWQEYYDTTMRIREESALEMKKEMRDMDKPKTEAALPKELKCLDCGKIFGNSGNLRMHRLSKHPAPISPPMPVSIP